jgi:probable F420-dependent oxidoreductase
MDLVLETTLKIGFQSVYPPAKSPHEVYTPDLAAARRLVEKLDRLGFDSFWAGDHVIFPMPIMDPLIQVAQAAAFSARLTLGTCVYLLPLRHPFGVAKQVGTLDLMSGGRLIFGVGVGGEFPVEYAACGVPMKERGARLTESIAVLRKLWSGGPVAHEGRFFPFAENDMRPPPAHPGGPPIWCGGRSDAALHRAGRIADGWMSYVVTPEMYETGLAKIARSAAEAKRADCRFGTGHLLYIRLDKDRARALDYAADMLSTRYGMDFRRPAERYCALGTPEQVAERIRAYHAAGVRHVVAELLAAEDALFDQIERFAGEVRPLLADLM